METNELLDLAAKQLAESRANLLKGCDGVPPAGFAESTAQVDQLLAQSRRDVADVEARVADMQAKFAEMRQTFEERKRQLEDAQQHGLARAQAEQLAIDDAPLSTADEIQEVIDRLIEAAAGKSRAERWQPPTDPGDVADWQGEDLP
jgi:hypothetical protein